jgi:hypothetical protein
MRKPGNLLGLAAQLILLVLLGVFLYIILNTFRGWNLQQIDSSTTLPYPPPEGPTATLPSYPPPPTSTHIATLEPLPTYPPTETIPPFPTQIPTPFVTPIPTARPPIIPLPPDGAQSYTLVYRDEDVLQAIESDGTNRRTLLDVKAQLNLHFNREELVWANPSPDGSQLAMALTDSISWVPKQGIPSPKDSIYLFNLTTGLPRLLVEDGVDPVWSPDGSRIAYRGPTRGLWIVDVASGDAREVYAVDRGHEHFVTEIDWSPDSQRLDFVLIRHSNREYDRTTGQLAYVYSM